MKTTILQHRTRRCFVALVLVSTFVVLAMVGCREKRPRSVDNPWDYAKVYVGLNDLTYEPGEPITVTARVVALTDIDLSGSWWCDTLSTWRIDLVDEQNQLVPLTGMGGSGAGCRLQLEISQDQPYEESFRLDTYFELSTPGTYTLTMAMDLSAWDLERLVDATSAPVTFTRLP